MEGRRSSSPKMRTLKVNVNLGALVFAITAVPRLQYDGSGLPVTWSYTPYSIVLYNIVNCRSKPHAPDMLILQCLIDALTYLLNYLRTVLTPPLCRTG